MDHFSNEMVLFSCTGIFRMVSYRPSRPLILYSLIQFNQMHIYTSISSRATYKRVAPWVGHVDLQLSMKSYNWFHYRCIANHPWTKWYSIVGAGSGGNTLGDNTHPQLWTRKWPEIKGAKISYWIEHQRRILSRNRPQMQNDDRSDSFSCGYLWSSAYI